jgi:ZIP family zinc transporter
MATADPTIDQPSAKSGLHLPTPVLVMVPLLLLIAVLVLIVQTDGGLEDRTLPPIETLTVKRVTLPEPDMITIDVINDGPDDVTIAQVLVDDAYWQFSGSHEGPLGRLESTTLSVPYPWVQDETHHIQILTSTGAIFEQRFPLRSNHPRQPDGVFCGLDWSASTSGWYRYYSGCSGTR